MQAQQAGWLPEVEAAVATLIDADATKQQEACDWIEQKFGSEAAATAARLFAEARFFKNPEVQPREEGKDDFADFAGVEGGPHFRDERAKGDDDPTLLSKASPFDSAKEFVRRHCFKEEMLATYYWGGDFWEWNDRCYEKVSAEKINAEIW